jgi:hypothetical protein
VNSNPFFGKRECINMSMIGNFLQLSSEELAALIADPSGVQSFIYPEGEECENSIDIDKAWHGIHYLLAGDAWGGEPPLANVVLGGTEIGEDFGYGPARYLTADEVRAVANALKDITAELLRSRYVASELSKNEIYPEIWDDPDDDAVGYLASYYQTLRDYYIDAAAKKSAMLKYLN